MKAEELIKIKQVYDQLNQGISNPIKINEVYSFLPNIQPNAPIRAKIVAINRFMMINYEDYLPQEPILESIGTIENKPKQSHSESNVVEIQAFLTKDEQEDLQSPLAGTVLEISKDSNKSRTRSKFMAKLKKEHPNMSEEWYQRNLIAVENRRLG